MEKNSARSARARFGGGQKCELADGQTLDVGEVICNEGPGEGFAMTPWALDRYERALGLTITDAWLLKRLLKHAWTRGSEVYVSQRRISREAIVSRNTVWESLRRLEAKGYIRLESKGTPFDTRRRYSVAGFYKALAYVIAADPGSTWARTNGGPIGKMQDV